jgi:predicted peroxiredoxin
MLHFYADQKLDILYHGLVIATAEEGTGYDASVYLTQACDEAVQGV